MKALVRDFMTPKLVYVQEDTRLELALHPMLELGITAVPVLDTEHHPVGVISLRDLVENRRDASSSSPVIHIAEAASMEDAARQLVESNVHHLVVVGEKGRAVGMLSSLDVVRAFLDSGAAHAR